MRWGKTVSTKRVVPLLCPVVPLVCPIASLKSILSSRDFPPFPPLPNLQRVIRALSTVTAPFTEPRR